MALDVDEGTYSELSIREQPFRKPHLALMLEDVAQLLDDIQVLSDHCREDLRPDEHVNHLELQCDDLLTPPFELLGPQLVHFSQCTEPSTTETHSVKASFFIAVNVILSGGANRQTLRPSQRRCQSLPPTR